MSGAHAHVFYFFIIHGHLTRKYKTWHERQTLWEIDNCEIYMIHPVYLSHTPIIGQDCRM